MKRGLNAIALLLLMLLTLTVVLSGCSDDKGDVSTDNNDPSEAENGGAAADGEAPTGDPSQGGEIVVGIAQDLDSSLDPHEMVAAGTAGTKEVLFNVFEGLVKPTSTGELIPAVAEDYTVDGTTYTFTLREGIRFHNGDPVTVEDIVYSIERCADASSVSTYVSAFSVVTEVTAVDDETVVIEIEEPDNEFLASLTAAIIPAGYDGQASAPVGTGPFRFVSYAPQESLVVERFDDYWGDGAYLDQVTFKIYGSNDSLIMAINSGAIDICAHLTTDMVSQLSEDYYYLEGTMNLVQAMYLNNAVEPLDNVLVRQALCYAVDVQEIMDVLADGLGSPVGSSMYPSFTKYFNEELVGYYSHDPDRARELLEEAGYADGFELVITVPSNYTPHIITAETIVQQLSAVGIDAKLDNVEWTYWLSEVYNGRQFQATVVGVDASSMTAQAMLDRFVSDSGKNFINFNSPDYDAKYEEARAATDDEEQVRLYKELQAILAEEAANVYLQDLCDLVAINGQLAGFQFYPLYILDMSTVYYVQ